MSAAERSFHSFAKHPAVEEAKFFGFRSLRLEGKTMLILDQDTLVFKLADAEGEAALGLPGAAEWNPYGRAKRNWVQIPESQAEHWPRYFRKLLPD